MRVVPIDVPTLAARGRAEIERLARHFADLYTRRYGRPEPRIEADALAALSAHRWPGNVRELEHWIESAIVLAPDGVIRASAFPERPPGPTTLPPEDDAARIPLGLTAGEARDAYIRATVRACGGNRSEAARRLGVSRNTVARAFEG